MKCPYCGADDTKVIDSRPAEDNNAIRRRRQCEKCNKRYTTYEKVESIPIIVIKKDNIKNNIDTNKKVKLIYHNEKFNYEVVDTCTNNSLTRNNIEVPIVTEDSGLYKSQTDQDRFIYRGGTPDNWIELNEGTEETPDYVKYRIISFENDGTIKVARYVSLTGVYWDEKENRNKEIDTYCGMSESHGCNVWGTQDDMLFRGTTLGNNFSFYSYPDENAVELKPTSTEGTITKPSTINQYLNNEWINNKYLSKYIIKHDFNVGIVDYSTITTIVDKGLKKEKTEESSFKWKGNIGLLNITEFVESSINPECTRVNSNYVYSSLYYYPNEGSISKSIHEPENGWPCSIQNYHMPSSSFTMTASPSSNGVWQANSNGFKQNSVGEIGVFQPAFYLKPDISLTGEGSEENPYRIVGES